MGKWKIASTIMDPHTDDVMLSFPDFNKPFLEIHVDASDAQ
jgi:hypothetical protein